MHDIHKIAAGVMFTLVTANKVINMNGRQALADMYRYYTQI